MEKQILMIINSDLVHIKRGQTVFVLAGQMAVERALASYTQTYREAHMVSDADTGTLSRLLTGIDSLCHGLRAQGLWHDINNTNITMEKNKGKNTGKIKRWGRIKKGKMQKTMWENQSECCMWFLSLPLHDFHFKSDWAEEMERMKFVQACETDKEKENESNSPWSWSESVSTSTRSPAHSTDPCMK